MLINFTVPTHVVAKTLVGDLCCLLKLGRFRLAQESDKSSSMLPMHGNHTLDESSSACQHPIGHLDADQLGSFAFTGMKPFNAARFQVRLYSVSSCCIYDCTIVCAPAPVFVPSIWCVPVGYNSRVYQSFESLDKVSCSVMQSMNTPLSVLHGSQKKDHNFLYHTKQRRLSLPR